MTSPRDVADALKTALENIDAVEVYSFVPPAPVLPALIVYPELWPYTVTQESTWVIWCIGGEVESKGAQERLNDWIADDVIAAALIDDQSLGSTISTLLPLEARNMGVTSMSDGRRVVQAEVVVNIWR